MLLPHLQRLTLQIIFVLSALANQSRLGDSVSTPRCCHAVQIRRLENILPGPQRKEIYRNTISSPSDVTQNTTFGWLSVSQRSQERSPAA